MFERFRWGLTSGERYSTGPLTPQKRGIHCACQHFVSERVGVLAEYGGVAVRLPLGLRSLTLLRCFFRHSSLVLVLCSCLTLQVMAPKAYLKAKPKLLQRRCAKGQGPGLRRYWAELHGWSFTRSCFWAGNLHKTRLRLIGPPLFPTSKRRRACSCFDDRNNVSSKERSAGTRCSLPSTLGDLFMTVATLGLGQFALLGHQQWREKQGVHAPQTKVHCLQADERKAAALRPANQENVSRRRFIPTSCAPQQECIILAAGRLQHRPPGGPKNKPAKEYYFRKREVAKTDPKMGPRGGPIFGSVQIKTQPDKRSPCFLLRIPRARMPLAPLTFPALAVPCSWPAICIDLSDTLHKRQIRTRSDPAASAT